MDNAEIFVGTHTHYETTPSSCFHLWKWYGRRAKAPFTMMPHMEFTAIVDANAKICLLATKEEAQIVVADWNANEVMYLMVVDTAAEESMPFRLLAD